MAKKSQQQWTIKVTPAPQ